MRHRVDRRRLQRRDCLQAGSRRSFTVLHSFLPAVEGSGPNTGLVPILDGNFAGPRRCAGGKEPGNAFKITPAGDLTVLHTFGAGPSAGGNFPKAQLLEATDGNFYGTTDGGGSMGLGTVFKMTPSGSVTTLYSFTGGADGMSPRAGLTQASDGTLYGTTSRGANGAGTVFKITPTGSLTVVYAVPADRVVGPLSEVVEGRDRNLYFTTVGGAPNFGTIVKLSPSGAATILRQFVPDTPGGFFPATAPLQAADGNFYGTTMQGASSNPDAPDSVGSVYRMTPSGGFTSTTQFVLDGEHRYAD